MHGPVLALDGTSIYVPIPLPVGKKYRKSVNNPVFIRNESLFFVSAVATCAFQLEHDHRVC